MIDTPLSSSWFATPAISEKAEYFEGENIIAEYRITFAERLVAQDSSSAIVRITYRNGCYALSAFWPERMPEVGLLDFSYSTSCHL